MPPSCIPDGDDPHRYVGDPVDVVTGANTSVERDFRLDGPIPIDWRRHLDSSLAHRRFALGWGHSHEYDRSLRIDADGLRYVGPLGRGINFPALADDGDQACAQGLVLRRLAPMRYRIETPGAPAIEFDFGDGSRPVPPAALVDGPHRVDFVYRGDGALQRLIESSGRSIRVECDDSRRITRMVLAEHAGRPGRDLIAYRYDDAGDLVQGIDAYRHPFSFAYDASHRLVRRVERRGYAFLFSYDAQGRCVHSRGEDGLYEVRLEYQPQRQRTRVTQADGGVWIYEYDSQRVLTQVVDPYGGVRRFATDGEGRVIEEIDAGGVAARWLYTPDGSFVGRQSTLGHFFAGHAPMFRPDQYAHRVPRCARQWFCGDLTDAPVPPAAATLPPAVAALLGSLLAALPASDEVDTLNDELGLLLREAHADGSARSWRYDPSGNTLQERDCSGAVTSARYGSWDLPIERIDALGRRTVRRYLRTGALTEVTDPGGVRSGFERDLKGRVSAFWYDGRCQERYAYDAADNLLARLDPDGRPLVERVIGPHHLETERRLASGEVQHFEYGPDGEYTGLRVGNSTWRFARDAMGHSVLDERNGLGVAHRFDGPGRLAETTVLGRFTTRYSFVASHHLRVTDPAGGVHDMFLPGDGIVLRVLAHGRCEGLAFDAQGRCVAQAHADRRSLGWSAPGIARWLYSADGDLLAEEDAQGRRARHHYDAAHRLCATTGPGDARSVFRHDDGDNLLAQPGLADAVIGAGHRLASANGEVFGYDGDGNLAHRRGPQGETRYHHDADHRLVACDLPQGRWEACYDPLGRRIRKSLGVGWREFVWDGDRLAAEIDHDGRLRVYVYPDAFAMVPLLWLDYDSADGAPADGRRRHPICNAQGAPWRVEDDDGHVLWSARQGAYGAALVDPGARIEVPLRWPGHYFDAETGLHYNRFRYYHPLWGRYLEPDPVGPEEGNNLYAYGPNPLDGVDVRGDCKSDGTTPSKKAKKKTTKKGDKAEADPPAPPRPLSDKQLQSAADFIRHGGAGTADGPHPKDWSTLTVTCGMENGQPVYTVTTSRLPNDFNGDHNLTPGERNRAAQVLGPNVRFPDEGRSPAGPNSFHAEQRGARATQDQTDRRQASSNQTGTTRADPDVGHFGAACGPCANCQRTATDSNGNPNPIRNVTGTVEDGGRPPSNR